MILNVTNGLTVEGWTEKEEIIFEPDSLQYGDVQYSITEKKPVILTVTNLSKGRAQLTGNTELTVALFCDRCLKEVPYQFSLEFSSEVLAPELGAAVSEEDADTCLIGYQLDVDALVYNEISINWPMKVLCHQDCKGICSVCGMDLNEGTCECDTFVPDPRLAAIKDIFNAGKEV